MFEGLFLFLVVLVVLLTEAIDTIECFWGEDALVWDSEGMEEVARRTPSSRYRSGNLPAGSSVCFEF